MIISRNLSAQELTEIKEWKSLLEQLSNNQELNNYALSKTRTQFNSLDELNEFIKSSPAKTQTEKAFVIFRWITNNFIYDINYILTRIPPSHEPETVLKTGLVVCIGYSNLYKELCTKVGIECITVTSWAKTGKKVEDHTWNAVRIDSKWRLVETTWASSIMVDENGLRFKKMYNPAYFMVPPHALMYTHFSEDQQYQFQERKLTMDQFKELPFLYIKHFLNVQSVIDSQTITESKNPIFIEYTAFEDAVLLGVLHTEDDVRIEDCVITQKDSIKHKYGFIVFLPEKKKKYNFKLLGKDNGGIHEYLYISDYPISRTSDDLNFQFPFYELEFDLGIKCTTHGSKVISTDKNPLFIEFSIPNDLIKDIELYGSLKNDTNQPIENSVQLQRDNKSCKYGMFLILPDKKTKYKLDISIKRGVDKEWEYFAHFLIFKTGDQISHDLQLLKYSLEYNLGIKCISHNSQLIFADKSELVFEYFVPEGVDLYAEIKDTNKKTIENMALLHKNFEKSNVFEIKLTIPAKLDRCFFDLFAKNDAKKTNYEIFVSSCTIINTNKKREKTDKKLINTFGREKQDFYILCPQEKYLNPKKEYEFKIYARNCVEVAIWADPNYIKFIQDKSNNNLWTAKTKFDKKCNAYLSLKLDPSKDADCICSYEII